MSRGENRFDSALIHRMIQEVRLLTSAATPSLGFKVRGLALDCFGMPKQLKEFLQRWLITTVAVLVATHIVHGIHYDNWQGLIVATLVLGLLNAFLRPI